MIGGGVRFFLFLGFNVYNIDEAKKGKMELETEAQALADLQFVRISVKTKFIC